MKWDKNFNDALCGLPEVWSDMGGDDACGREFEYPPEEIMVFGRVADKIGTKGLKLTNANRRHKNGRRVRI